MVTGCGGGGEEDGVSGSGVGLFVMVVGCVSGAGRFEVIGSGRELLPSTYAESISVPVKLFPVFCSAVGMAETEGDGDETTGCW